MSRVILGGRVLACGGSLSGCGEILPDVIAKMIFGLRSPDSPWRNLKDVAEQKGLQIRFEEALHHGGNMKIKMNYADDFRAPRVDPFTEGLER